MRAIGKALLPIPLLLTSTIAAAAEHYVRAGAGGSGVDWANALSELPTPLVRGDVYYIADGSYPGYTFDTPVSGSLPITIKKATALDHGSGANWNASYGDGQAVFTGAWNIKTSHWILDGQVRNEADWFQAAAYGFVIDNRADEQINMQNYGNAPSDVSVGYVYLSGIVGNLPNTTIRRYAVDVDDFDGGSTSTGLRFHHMFVNGSNNVWFLRTTDGAIVEYSASSNAEGNGANHAEIVNLYYSGNNAIIRYNQFRDAFLNGGGTALIAIVEAGGLQCYGNVFWNFSVGDGSVGFLGNANSHETHGNRVYNNTIVGARGAAGFSWSDDWGVSSDNVAWNNLFAGNGYVGLQGTHDYNAFSDDDSRGEANSQVNVPPSIFVNATGHDYRLASPTLPGAALPAPFDSDLLGHAREATSWDRGAYEYVTETSETAPSAPSNLKVR